MNNIEIAKQTLQIIADRQYEVSGQSIHLPDYDYEDVVVYSPKDGAKLLESNIDRTGEDIGKNDASETSDISKKNDIQRQLGELCKLTITTEDSFQAARRYERPLVMNFANAHNPGGGFKLGANAQEEALCRCSTLYASITSKKASEMYHFNNTHISKVESDYMLLSPNVCVFRDEKYELLIEPKMASVITLPAPNRYGAALLASKKTIEETMLRRIRIMFLIAADNGYKNLVLGAWGCGAFGNKSEDVSGYFRTVLVDEGYGRYFDEVCFAIYGNEDGKNITAFRKMFG